MIAYSSKSMRAFAALYRPYNSFDIYVEDQTLIGFYERLIRRILMGRATITAVIPLGNKEAVLREARRLRKDDSRKRLFIVDGDFDWILRRIRIKDVYVLQHYSIENIAFDFDAIRDLACQLAPHKSSSAIFSAFSDTVMTTWVEELWQLFVLYCACAALDARFPTVSFPVRRLCISPQVAAICPTRIKKRKFEIYKRLLSSFPKNEIRSALDSCKQKIHQKCNNFDSRLISGKDHIIPMIALKFQNDVHFRGSNAQLLSMISDRIFDFSHTGLSRKLIEKATK